MAWVIFHTLTQSLLLLSGTIHCLLVSAFSGPGLQISLPIKLKFMFWSFSLSHLYKVCMLVAPSCPTLCNPLDYSRPGSSVHGILEWLAIPFSRRSSQPTGQIWVSCIRGQIFTISATREPLPPPPPRFTTSLFLLGIYLLLVTVNVDKLISWIFYFSHALTLCKGISPESIEGFCIERQYIHAHTCVYMHAYV